MSDVTEATQITFKAQIWAIDSWDSEQAFIKFKD
jgi:hypothetical protein